MPVASLLVLGAALNIAAFPIQLPQNQSMQDTAQGEVIATSPDRADRLTVPVTIGGRGPFRFLIDTGAMNTVVSDAVATQLSLQPDAKATVVGVAGRELVDTVHLDEIGIGRRSYYSMIAPILQSNHIGADGIIGLDSLQDQRVLIDFKNNLMAVADAETLGGNRGFEIVVTARRKSGQLIMTDATIDGVRTMVVIDTGAESSIGNRALQKALSHRSSRGQTLLRSVTGQEILADLDVSKSLSFDQITIYNVAIAYADAPPFAALDLDKRPALLLGMRELRTFKRVAIDFSTRRVLFDLPADFGAAASYNRAQLKL